MLDLVKRQAALAAFRAGTVIPAHPLALNADLALDERRQRALTRYYLAAGAGGIAVGVHTTQFAIHHQARYLLRPVLELASQTCAEHPSPVMMIAGACGPTQQAVAEAALAAELGYHGVLLAPHNAASAAEDDLIGRAKAVGEILPVIGFYLQPAVGGRHLSRQFWSRLADLPTLIGIKVAPFNRYATLDVLFGVAASSRAREVTLYTGNDDHIIGDLLMKVPNGDRPPLEFVGGLLGQWSMWTRSAVRLLDTTRRAKGGDRAAWRQAQEIDAALTDANGAIFDVAGGFRGCVPGIHEVLRRQGLLAGTWCLDPDEVVSEGQMREIDRVWEQYPQLRDDDFVAEGLDRWLA